MASNKSLNQIINLFNEIGAKHKQINHFYFGSFLSAMKEENISYPLLVVDTISAGIDRNNLNLSLIISVCDKVYKDHSNMNEVQSDMLSILGDIVDTMDSDKWKSFSNMLSTSNAQRFVDRSLDEVTGWAMNLTLTITSKKDLCAIPFDDYDFDGNYTRGCDPVEIFEDGILVDTIQSGGSYSYTSGGSPQENTSFNFKTGQETSYRTGDDGDLQLGNGVDLYTLNNDNGFDNTARFTDLNGNDWNGVGATGNLIIDWGNWDRVNNVVAVWNKGFNGLGTWNEQIDWGLLDNLSTGYLTGWHLPNKNETNMVIDTELGEYPAFFDSPGSDFWTSTTYFKNTATAYYAQTGSRLNIRGKTSVEGGRQLRYYTLTELGL